MDPTGIQTLNPSIPIVLTLLTVLSLLILLGLGWLGYRFTNREWRPSPFGPYRLRPCEELSFEAAQRVHSFLMGEDLGLNPSFELGRAAVCEGTGRIIPNGVNAFGVVKRPGNFVQRHFGGAQGA